MFPDKPELSIDVVIPPNIPNNNKTPIKAVPIEYPKFLNALRKPAASVSYYS